VIGLTLGMCSDTILVIGLGDPIRWRHRFTEGVSMKVHIDDLLTVECVSIAGYWNGWARPLFTREQLDSVRDALVASGVLLYDFDGNEIADSASVDMTTLDYVIKWDGEEYPSVDYIAGHPNDLYEICGWIWDTVDEICDYCGYPCDSSVKCECGAIS
jgi:hypothetical protein